MFFCKAISPLDLLDMNLVNLDHKTENYNMEFYLHHLLNYGDNCFQVQNTEGHTAAYLLGSSRTYAGTDEPYTHVTALSVAPQSRGQGLGALLMSLLELNGRAFASLFIDLFVRVQNTPAVDFYRRLGYGVHQTIEGYYSDPKEDAYDMRKYLSPSTAGPQGPGCPSPS